MKGGICVSQLYSLFGSVPTTYFFPPFPMATKAKSKPAEASTKPQFILRSGAVTLAAFCFKAQRKDGKTFDNWSFACTRSYMKNGQYVHSTFLQKGDMLAASALLEQAWQKLQVTNYVPSTKFIDQK